MSLYWNTNSHVVLFSLLIQSTFQLKNVNLKIKLNANFICARYIKWTCFKLSTVFFYCQSNKTNHLRSQNFYKLAFFTFSSSVKITNKYISKTKLNPLQLNILWLKMQMINGLILILQTMLFKSKQQNWSRQWLTSIYLVRCS